MEQGSGMIGRTIHRATPLLGAALILLIWCVTSASGGPISTPHAHDSELDHAVHDAAHAVDEAWEVFHQAALSGTLASPEIQTRVEKYLHESRTLLLKARKALDENDRETVERVVGQIQEYTAQAITLSREPKR